MSNEIEENIRKLCSKFIGSDDSCFADPILQKVIEKAENSKEESVSLSLAKMTL